MDGKEKKQIEKNLTISLKEYVDTIFVEKQRAIDKAENMMNKRLEGMNEFRDTLRDQASRFMTREEICSQTNILTRDIKTLQKLADIAEGKASQTSFLVSLILSVAALVAGILGLLLK